MCSSVTYLVVSAKHLPVEGVWANSPHLLVNAANPMIPWDQFEQSYPYLCNLIVRDIKPDALISQLCYLNVLSLSRCDLSAAAASLKEVRLSRLYLGACTGLSTLDLNGSPVESLQVEWCEFAEIASLDRCRNLCSVSIFGFEELRHLPSLPTTGALQICQLLELSKCEVDDSLFNQPNLVHFGCTRCPVLSQNRDLAEYTRSRQTRIVFYGSAMRAALMLIVASQRRRILWLPTELWHLVWYEYLYIH